MAKHLLVFGEKTFKITVPDEAKLTFGPWSPPTANKSGMYNDNGNRALAGTLRVYVGNDKNILAVFSGVSGFRDLSLEYAEEVAKEEGATIWKSDQNGYEREEKVSKQKEWVGQLPQGEASRDPVLPLEEKVSFGG